jgi:glutamine synthetase
VNSYKRLVPGYEAPCHIAWSAKNRSPLIRIPAARGEWTRIELRNPDPSCNPYLTLAVILAAGLDGVQRGLVPPPPANVNIYQLSAAERKARGIGDLPADLDEALDALEQDSLLRQVLGEHIFSKYLAAKRQEWEHYRTSISQWELDEYLRKV